MGQFLFFAAIGAAAVYGYQRFKREAKRVTEQLRRQERETANRSMGTLIFDPETGEYRLPRQ
jgi:membrane protein implicated in regulation of membrane protease activity